MLVSLLLLLFMLLPPLQSLFLVFTTVYVLLLFMSLMLLFLPWTSVNGTGYRVLLYRLPVCLWGPAWPGRCLYRHSTNCIPPEALSVEKPCETVGSVEQASVTLAAAEGCDFRWLMTPRHPQRAQGALVEPLVEFERLLPLRLKLYRITIGSTCFNYGLYFILKFSGNNGFLIGILLATKPLKTLVTCDK